MKKTIFLLYLVTAIFISGCTNKTDDINITDNEITDSEIINNETAEQNSLNEFISIYNNNDELINEFNVYGSIHLTNDSFIYGQIPSGIVDEITSLDYYRYDFETTETVKLGTIEDWVYESRYNTVYVNNHLYFLATIGDENDYYSFSVGLYKFDLNKNDLSMVFSIEDVTPYNSMTAVGDKLLITYPLNSGGCVVEEYNTKSKERETVLKFDFDNETSTGLAVRQITSDENTISFLMLKVEENGNTSIYTDIYDHDMNFLQQVNLDAISKDTEEIRQAVTCFIM